MTGSGWLTSSSRGVDALTLRALVVSHQLWAVGRTAHNWVLEYQTSFGFRLSGLGLSAFSSSLEPRG